MESQESTVFLWIDLVHLHDLEVEAEEVPQDLERIGEKHCKEAGLWSKEQLLF